jgi:hypothetical protein
LIGYPEKWYAHGARHPAHGHNTMAANGQMHPLAASRLQRFLDTNYALIQERYVMSHIDTSSENNRYRGSYYVNIIEKDVEEFGWLQDHYYNRSYVVSVDTARRRLYFLPSPAPPEDDSVG